MPQTKAHLLFFLCISYTFCILCNGIQSNWKDKNNTKQDLTYRKLEFDKRKEIACRDLFRKPNEQLITKYWILIEMKNSPYYYHKCWKYLTSYLAQIKRKKFKMRIVQKRDTNSKNNKSKESDKKISKNKDGSDTGPVTPTLFPSTTSAFEPMGTGSKSPNSHEENSNTMEDQQAGFEIWMYVLIGIAATIVVIIPISLSFVIYKRRKGTQHQPSNPKIVGEASDLMYETQRSQSTDKGTERSKSTISTYLSKDSRDIAEAYELAPLTAETNRGRSSVLNMFQDIESDKYEDNLRQFSEYDRGLRSPACVNERNVTSESRSNVKYLQHPKRWRANEYQSDREASSLAKSNEDRDYRLYRGNIDVHRSGQDDVNETNTYTRPREYIRNESRSSSSTRSYISIPPTSPSENYIKAGFDETYLPLEHQAALTKMTWLTKNLKAATKNDFGSYHASLGTQTDSDNSIINPKCDTVFGTSWQFGGTFTSRGGLMQAKDSDVCLSVVPNAVSKGEYVDIYGAVFTDTIEIRKKLIFSTNETLITPVVEYHAVPDNPFQRPICVQLPHALPEEFDISLIKVYTFSVDDQGTIFLRNLSMSSKENDGRNLEACWEKGADGHSIHISTTHFSGYFCTQCESSSWPSICTMVFGSHVQITPSHREVRVILYIWDHKLTIKDYLERFRKQESDVDRQLLTDMQVPLLDNATSDSHLVMCMEVMGANKDRKSWRHILRPDSNRPLFKPLQVRKLREIVHCCRLTDPICIEWALENKPNEIPSAVFQCCIDVMHVHESTRDYETAMREDTDDLMRTFYVRDLKMVTNTYQEPETRNVSSKAELKRTLSSTMDVSQTERMCQEFGISVKDIGNFRKKFSTEKALQIGLVEECLTRHGSEKFWNLLPTVLERLNYTDVLLALNDKDILPRHHSDNTNVYRLPPVKSVNENVPHLLHDNGNHEESTECKSSYRRSSSSSNEINQSKSPMYRYRQHLTENTIVSDKCNELSIHKSKIHKHRPQAQNHNESLDRKSRHTGHERDLPPVDYNVNEQFTNAYMNHGVKYEEHCPERRQLLKHDKSSSSGADSLLGSSSHNSRDNNSAYFTSQSSFGTSRFAHVDPTDFAEPFPDELLDDSLKQTYKKEFLVNANIQSKYLSKNYAPYQNANDGHFVSGNGPYALVPETGNAVSSSISDPVSPYKKHSVIHHDNSKPLDKDQTIKKELYGTTV